MRVAVIGAGVVGTMTAYYLHQRNCEVEVFESAASAGAGASNANGGQLSYSFADSMADPQILPKLPHILLNRDPAFKINLSADPSFLSWGLRFISHCTRRRRDANTAGLVTLALRSLALMAEFHDKFGQQFASRRAGKLVLMSEAPDEELRRRINFKRSLGTDIRIVSRDEVLDIEPTLAGWRWQPSAALYSPSDEVGDALRFVTAVCDYLSQQGVLFAFNNPVSHLQQLGKHGWQVSSRDHSRRFDAVVVCTGDAARPLLAPLRIKLPVLPVAGYSVTLPRLDASPTTSITALDHRTVFSPINGNVRVAGFADMNARPAQRDQRVAALLDTCAELAPDAADYRTPDPKPWMGYRPMTPSSLPITGPTALPGLYTNLGHGMLGWTLSAATGQQLAAAVTTR